MNYLLWTMMMCAVAAMTVRGQYLVDAPVTAMFGPIAGWTGLASNAVDNSNMTCVMTDYNGPSGRSLKVIYSTTQFVPSTIYLVGPTPFKNDFTFTGTLVSVAWGIAGGTSMECACSDPLSVTNNVLYCTCGPVNKGTQLTITVKTDNTTRIVSICNVIVYSNDAQFWAPVNGPLLVTAAASVSMYPASNWISTLPGSYAVDDSNTTCVMTDVNVPTGNYNYLSVSYSATPFRATTIYLVGPSIVPYDMIVGGNIERVVWNFDTSYTCTAGTTFSSTSNVASYICSNVGRGNSLQVYIKGLVQINLIFCNVLVYSNDAQFLSMVTTSTTSKRTTNSKARLTGIIDYLLESIKLSMSEIRSLYGYWSEIIRY